MSADYEDLLGGPGAPDASVTVPIGASGEMATVGGSYPGHVNNGQGVYDSTNRRKRELAQWRPSRMSVDLEMLPSKHIIEGQTRDVLRKDTYAQGAISLHKDSIVGAIYALSCRPLSTVIFGTYRPDWEDAFREEVEAKWELYANSPNHWVDAARINNFTALVRLAVGIHLMSGENLATVEFRKDDGSPYATCIQMVDIDRLSDPQDGSIPWWNMPNQRAGVEYDSYGAPQNYYIRTAHPNDYGPIPMQLPTWKKVPLKKPWGRIQVIHLFEQLRPDQTRGFTQLASALSTIKQTHEWRDINIQNAVTQATFAAAIKSEAPPSDIYQAMNGNPSAAGMAGVYTDYCEGYLETVGQYTGESGGMALDAVKIPRLLPGEELTMISPGKGGPLGSEFEQSLLRSIAAAVGVSYEQLSRDYTNTNYSSARAAMLETWKYMQAQKKLIADRFATTVFRLWLEEAINNGKIKTAQGIKIYDDPAPGQKYGVLNETFDALTQCEWIGASRGQIDETKETEAAQMRMEMGISTAEEEAGRLGKDWRKVYRQLAREKAMRADLGLEITESEKAAAALASTPTDTATPSKAPAKKGSAK